MQHSKYVLQIVGSDAGAACDLDAGRAQRRSDDSSSTPNSRYVKRRFQRSSLDEVSFAGPDVGPLSCVLIGPERGAWKLNEVIISNSRENLMQRFICREHLGSKRGNGAAFMSPVPAEAVVYGSGSNAVVLSRVRCPVLTVVRTR
jgi:hypothetical protein